MPSGSSNANPFTDHALRPTTSNATSLPGSQLRSQASQASLRSNAGSAASHRSRAPRDLFAPGLSRRAPGQTAHRRADAVRADSDSDHDVYASSSAARQPRLRRVRHMSPDTKPAKTRPRQEEVLEFVNRQPDGSFLTVIPGQAEALKEHLTAPELQEEARTQSVDEEYVAVARQFFTSGASLHTGRSRHTEQEYDEFQVPMMAHLRTQVLDKLDEERWRYEPTAP